MVKILKLKSIQKSKYFANLTSVFGFREIPTFFLKLLICFKKKVGISLNPNTEVNIIENELENVDLVLVMSVHPGFGGQKFIHDVIKKIELLKKLKDDKNYKYDIEVDGGINFSNSKDVINAGANILVSGTTIFKENNGNIKKNIETLKEV